jgi:hypothetical protein
VIENAGASQFVASPEINTRSTVVGGIGREQGQGAQELRAAGLELKVCIDQAH